MTGQDDLDQRNAPANDGGGPRAASGGIAEPSRSRRRLSRRARLVLASAIVVLPLLGLLGYHQFYLYRPTGSGPTAPPVPADSFRRPWLSGKALLLGVGDSVTQGYGSSPGHSYFQRLAANPSDEFDDMNGICLAAVIPQLTARNIAVAGSNSIQHLQAVRNMEVQSADITGIVVLTTGGNDVLHNYGHSPPRDAAMYGATLEQAAPWIEAFHARLEEIVDLLGQRFPGGCHIFLANIYDPTDGSGDVRSAVPGWVGIEIPAWPQSREILSRVNRVIAQAAGEHKNVHLVNVHDTMLGHGIDCRKFWRSSYRSDDPTFWYQAFLEDPNDRGHDAIRRLFLLEMARQLAAR